MRKSLIPGKGLTRASPAAWDAGFSLAARKGNANHVWYRLGKSQTLWLNLTNLALGIVTLLAVLVLA